MGSEKEAKEATPDVEASLNLGHEEPRKKPRRKRKTRPNNRNRQRRLVKWIAERFPDSFDETHPTIEIETKSDPDPAQSDPDRVFGDLNPAHDPDAGKSGPDPARGGTDADTRVPDSAQRDPDPAHGHILEIAGGQGELAVRLAMFYHRRVVMIDPRTADIARTFETQVCPRLPLNRKQQWKDTLAREDAGFLRDRVKEKISHIATYFTEEAVENDNRVREAVENASLIVALHPDKPTEAIIDAALTYRKPFVVIPCCVFPNFFQKRTVVIEAGQAPVRVRNYEQLCRYLVEKHAGFRMETLPFEGRNVAIWWDGVSDTAEL